MTFERDALSRDASLNQLVVLGGPYNGRSGGDLLSRDALAQLEPGLDPHRLTDALNGRPHMAAEVAAETGHRLAALVATLRRRATSAVTGITEGRRRYLEESPVWRAITWCE